MRSEIYNSKLNTKSQTKMRTSFALAMAHVATAFELGNTTDQIGLADPDCACLTSNGALVYADGETREPYIIPENADVNAKYPSNYGVGMCSAWDEFLFGYGCADEEGNPNADAQAFCTTTWCYVKEACT